MSVKVVINPGGKNQEEHWLVDHGRLVVPLVFTHAAGEMVQLSQIHRPLLRINDQGTTIEVVSKALPLSCVCHVSMRRENYGS